MLSSEYGLRMDYEVVNVSGSIDAISKQRRQNMKVDHCQRR